MLTVSAHGTKRLDPSGIWVGGVAQDANLPLTYALKENRHGGTTAMYAVWLELQSYIDISLLII